MKTFRKRLNARFFINYRAAFQYKNTIRNTYKNEIEITLNKLLIGHKCTLLNIENINGYLIFEFEAHPSLDLSRVLGNLKTVTSRRMKKEFEIVDLWEKGYFVESYLLENVSLVFKKIKG